MVYTNWVETYEGTQILHEIEIVQARDEDIYFILVYRYELDDQGEPLELLGNDCIGFYFGDWDTETTWKIIHKYKEDHQDD